MGDPQAEAGFRDVAVFSLPNRIEALRPMSNWLVDAVQALGAPARAAGAFELAANEAVANIIEHAFPEGGLHEILLRLACVDDGVRLEIVDRGRPFDPLALPDPVEPAALEAARVGGLGVALIRRSVDRCRYERRGDSNVLTLFVKSGPTGP